MRTGARCPLCGLTAEILVSRTSSQNVKPRKTIVLEPRAGYANFRPERAAIRVSWAEGRRGTGVWLFGNASKNTT